MSADCAAGCHSKGEYIQRSTVPAKPGEPLCADSYRQRVPTNVQRGVMTEAAR